MSEKAKFVLGISLGLTLFILLIIGFVILYILIKKRMKLKEKRNNENSEILNAKIKEYAKKYDFIFFNKALINLSEDRMISLKGPILISTEALVLIHPLYLEGKVDGNCLEREWYKKLDDAKKEIYFPNPIMDDDNIIKQLMPLLPEDVPILTLYIMLNDQSSFDIYNQPGHVIFSKNNELDEKLMQIKSELKNSISDKKLKETIEKLNELIKK